MNSSPVSLYQTADGLKHNGKRMRVTAGEVWKLVLFGHGILDVALGAKWTVIFSFALHYCYLFVYLYPS